MAEKTLSPYVCKAVAQEFLEGSVELGHDQEDGISYNLTGGVATVREQRRDGVFHTTPPDGTEMVVAGGGDWGEIRIYKVPVADFVCGVAYALSVSERSLTENVTSQNLSRICFELGQLSALNNLTGAES